MSRPTPGVRLYLLRHGEVRSHEGDVPITEEAKEQAEEVGAGLAGEGRVTIICGETRRAKETADHLGKGIERSGGSVVGPTVAHALRNPDLYLSGHRVDMVSSHEAFAEQVPGLEVGEVAGLEFFPEFVAQPDRIGWWLVHPNPPGEGATVIAARIDAFARSFVNPYHEDRAVIAAVTHSPLLRAVGRAHFSHDIGEPAWISGLTLDVDLSGDITAALFPGGD